MAKKNKDLVIVFGENDQMSFNASDDFLFLLRQAAKRQGVSVNFIFQELTELMTEELIRMLD